MWEGHFKSHADNKVEEGGEKSVLAGEVCIVAIFPGAVVLVEIAKDEELGVRIR